MIPVVNNNNYVNNQWFIMFPKLDFNFWCSISVCRWHGASLRSNLALKIPSFHRSKKSDFTIKTRTNPQVNWLVNGWRAKWLIFFVDFEL